jgi:hypothetical protein
MHDSVLASIGESVSEKPWAYKVSYSISKRAIQAVVGLVKLLQTLNRT